MHIYDKQTRILLTALAEQANEKANTFLFLCERECVALNGSV